jgi:molecular chaperone GrpE (heat shock protein)
LDALADVGVKAIEVPAGTRFDPERHRAADTVMTEEETLAGVVAQTERLGFVDRGRRLRWPEVLVYQTAGDGVRTDVA